MPSRSWFESPFSLSSSQSTGIPYLPDMVFGDQLPSPLNPSEWTDVGPSTNHTSLLYLVDLGSYPLLYLVDLGPLEF